MTWSERLYANVCKYRPCGNAGNTLEITHYWNIMTHVIQAEWTIHQMSRPNPLFCLTVVSNSDWRIWVRPEQTSVFPAFHTRTICFGPFLKVSISYSFSHFCRTPSLLRKVWTKNEWKGRADWQRNFLPLAVDSLVKGAGDLECLGALVSHSSRISLPISEGKGQMMDERRETALQVCLAALQVYESLWAIVHL